MPPGDEPDLDMGGFLDEKSDELSRLRRKRQEYNEEQVKSGRTPISCEDRDIVDWWHRVATGQHPLPREFLKFIALWEAFNGLINCRLSLKQRTEWGDKRKTLSLLEDAIFIKGWQDLCDNFNFSALLDQLSTYCPVYEVRGSERIKGYTINRPYS